MHSGVECGLRSVTATDLAKYLNALKLGQTVSYNSKWSWPVRLAKVDRVVIPEYLCYGKTLIK